MINEWKMCRSKGFSDISLLYFLKIFRLVAHSLVNQSLVLGLFLFFSFLANIFLIGNVLCAAVVNMSFN